MVLIAWSVPPPMYPANTDGRVCPASAQFPEELEPVGPFVLYMIYFPVLLAEWLLNCFADVPPSDSREKGTQKVRSCS